MENKRARIVVLVGSKGRGSNMQALVQASAAGEIPADIVRVIAPKADAPALQKATELGIPAQVVEFGESYEARLLAATADADFLCLAGFLRLVPNAVLQRFAGRALNIHPSLLPKFGGKGMYGHHVHEAVVAAGEAESGCTVHQVSEIYDEGEIIVQLRCPLDRTDTPEEVAAKVLALEHIAYPEAIRRVLNG